MSNSSILIFLVIVCEDCSIYHISFVCFLCIQLLLIMGMNGSFQEYSRGSLALKSKQY